MHGLLIFAHSPENACLDCVHVCRILAKELAAFALHTSVLLNAMPVRA